MRIASGKSILRKVLMLRGCNPWVNFTQHFTVSCSDNYIVLKSKNIYFKYRKASQMTFVHKSCSKSGMHNIRPAGQMWPAKAFNLACLAKHFVLLASFLNICTLWMGKNISFWPLGIAKKKIVARHEIWVGHPCYKLLVKLTPCRH